MMACAAKVVVLIAANTIAPASVTPMSVLVVVGVAAVALVPASHVVVAFAAIVAFVAPTVVMVVGG